MSEYYSEKSRYDDIIDLPHHQSLVHPHMSLHDRAAQFAPFAALTGHEEAIGEVARLTDEKITLDETVIENINQKLQELLLAPSKSKKVAITYFRPDSLKKGGVYLTDIGTIKKLDELEQSIIMDSGMKIPMEHVVEIEEEKMQ